MISIFTPTHDASFLLDAYQSLLDQQSPPPWEWVIVPNGGDVAIPAQLRADARIRILPAAQDDFEKGVGALKKFACGQCRGDLFLELDHDDLLSPDALRRIADAAQQTGAGFLYSDFCEFREDGTSRTYKAKFGWEAYPVTFRGRAYQATRAFAPTAASIAQIFYAPNHVRVWSRAAYEAAGGHDANLAVVDDHDLLCRTYLAGVGFHHIPECLYFYRLRTDGGNTYLKRNAEIQKKQQEISNQYIYRLIREWCRREGLPRIDLGGAHNAPKGFVSVDLAGAQVNCDIRRGLPFEDGSVGCVRAYDFLEHIPRCVDSNCRHSTEGAGLCTVGLMNEIHRVLAPGGWLISRTPSTDGRGAFQDPTHVSFWNQNSFWYYTRREQARFVPGITCRFQASRVWQEFPDDWHRNNNILYVYADLVALKGQRQPGLVEI